MSAHEPSVPRDAEHCDYPDCEQHYRMIVEHAHDALLAIQGSTAPDGLWENKALHGVATEGLRYHAATELTCRPATPEETAQIDEAVRAGRITFDPGWNSHKPGCPRLTAAGDPPCTCGAVNR
jgi:hypothetical protein